MIDSIEKKLQAALARELHLQCSLETMTRERDTLQNRLLDALLANEQQKSDLNHAREKWCDAVINFTWAKQDTANALHELRSAKTVIEYYGNKDNWCTEDGFVDAQWCMPCDGHARARQWLHRHHQQTKAPIMDPEAEAEQAKEKMLEEER